MDTYQSVLQHPDLCFSLPDLQNGSLETDLWGLPRVRSGGFALTYRVSNHTKNFAVRCFHKNIPDRYSRYQAIQATLLRLKIKYLVPIHYAGKGIKVGKYWYPITIMPWVDGETLENYLFHHLNDIEAIKHITRQLIECVEVLQKNHLAHGDLSHQNLMVSGNQLILVDYDGFYVPTLKGKKSCELGHANFQHPARTLDQFDERLDRFSSIVIYLALRALSINPDLWNKYEKSGEGILFRKTDFINPYESELLQELETYSGLRKMIYFFRKICLSGIENIPTLYNFIHLDMPDLPRDEIFVPSRGEKSNESGLDATKRYLFSNQLGKVITVVGEISDIHYGKTKDNHPHIYLNFGNWRSKGFTVLLWDKGFDHFSPKITDQQLSVGSWVAVTGILTSYRRRPQIAIDSPFGLEILGSAVEAYQRMGLAAPVETIESNKIKLTDTIEIRNLRSETTNESQNLNSRIYNKKKLEEYDSIVAQKINELYK